MQQQASSRWPQRLLIVALAITLLGSLLLAMNTEELDSIFDPRLNNEVEFQGEDTHVVNISSGCYRAISIDGNSDFEIIMTKLDGSARVGGALENKNCLIDFQAMSSDNTDFKTVASWQVTESAEYALDIECSASADCQEQVGWLVSVDEIQYGMFESKGLLAGGFMCVLGILLLPLSGILMAASRSKGKSKMMIVQADGTLTPVTNLNQAMIQQINNGEEFQQVVGNEVAGPFADSPPTLENSQSVSGPFADSGIGQQDGSFVDGSGDVQSGIMMTTDQVYALMRGDVEGAGELVQDPFVTAKLQPTPTEKQRNIQQKENDVLISSWDEGGSGSVKVTPPITPANPSKTTPVVPIKNDSAAKEDENTWKQWDEM
ncbi:MAG: hypothetical protein OSB30_04170 [Candidatus Poseidoniaceae archaeon]|nr:hypothetical protein [Candidatus Poseidoniaceae archaeon]